MGYDFGALKNSNEIFSVDTKPIIGERVIFDKMSNFGSPILKDYNYESNYSCGSGGNIPAYKYDDEDLNV